MCWSVAHSQLKMSSPDRPDRPDGDMKSKFRNSDDEYEWSLDEFCELVDEVKGLRGGLRKERKRNDPLLMEIASLKDQLKAEEKNKKQHMALNEQYMERIEAMSKRYVSLQNWAHERVAELNEEIDILHNLILKEKEKSRVLCVLIRSSGLPDFVTGRPAGADGD